MLPKPQTGEVIISLTHIWPSVMKLDRGLSVRKFFPILMARSGLYVANEAVTRSRKLPGTFRTIQSASPVMLEAIVQALISPRTPPDFSNGLQEPACKVRLIMRRPTTFSSGAETSEHEYVGVLTLDATTITGAASSGIAHPASRGL